MKKFRFDKKTVMIILYTVVSLVILTAATILMNPQADESLFSGESGIFELTPQEGTGARNGEV